MRVINAMEKPIQIHADADLRTILHAILEGNQPAAVVVDDKGHLLGLVGTHDVLRKIVPHYLDMGESLAGLIHEGYFEERFANLQGVHAADIMSTKLDTLTPNDTIIKAATLFVEHNRKVIPVVEGDRVVGAVTRRSLLWRVAQHLNG